MLVGLLHLLLLLNLRVLLLLLLFLGAECAGGAVHGSAAGRGLHEPKDSPGAQHNSRSAQQQSESRGAQAYRYVLLLSLMRPHHQPYLLIGARTQLVDTVQMLLLLLSLLRATC
jgi:hypothetical protein